MPEPDGTPDPISQAVRTLAGGDRTAVLAAFKANAPGLWQAVFQEGHNVGYGQGHGALATANNRVSELTQQITTLTSQLNEARQGGTPDVQRIHADYRTQIENLTTTHQARERDLLGRLEGLALRTTRSELRRSLERQGVDPEYAGVLVERAETNARLQVKEDHPVTVLQAGTQIPVVAGGGTSPLDVLAGELVSTVPPKFIVSRVDAGSGSGADRGYLPPAPNGLGRPDAAFLDKVKADKEAELAQARKDREGAARNLEAIGLSAPGSM